MSTKKSSQENKAPESLKFMGAKFPGGANDMQALESALSMTEAKREKDPLCNEVTWTFSDGSSIEIFSGMTYQINYPLSGFKNV